MDEDLEIKLDLPNLHPSRVPGSELAEMLRDLERAVEAESATDADNFQGAAKVPTIRPTGTTSKAEDAEDAFEDSLVSLVAVRAGSAAYGFKFGSKATEPARRILRGLAVGGFEWASVTPPAQEIITKTISRFTRKNISVGITPRLADIPSIRFTRELPPPVVNESLFAKAPATRSVHVIKAGGVRPTATVMLLGKGDRVQVQGPRKYIQELGRLLYKRAIIVGKAQWRLKDWRLVSFKVDRVDPFPGEDMTTVLSEAAALAGDAIESSGGVAGFLSAFRDEDEE